MRATLDFIVCVWDGHVLAMPCWHQPEILEALEAIMRASATPCDVRRAYEQLTVRRCERFAGDARAVPGPSRGPSGKAVEACASFDDAPRPKSPTLLAFGHVRGPQGSRAHSPAATIRGRDLVRILREGFMAAGRHCAVRKTSNRRASRSRSG
jgi:hypothetical protein